MRWIYKKSREFARRMKCYRGENAANHPTFDAPSLAAIVPNDTPRDCNEPEIVYTAEDDKRIDEYFRKRGEHELLRRIQRELTAISISPNRLAFGKIIDARIDVAQF